MHFIMVYSLFNEVNNTRMEHISLDSGIAINVIYMFSFPIKMRYAESNA